jgi:hypothetical protein
MSDVAQCATRYRPKVPSLPGRRFIAIELQLDGRDMGHTRRDFSSARQIGFEMIKTDQTAVTTTARVTNY